MVLDNPLGYLESAVNREGRGTLPSFYITLPIPQKRSIPKITVPLRDFVFKAKRKVGMATSSSGRNNSTRLGSPVVISNGKRRALSIATGIKSSPSTSQLGRLRLARAKSGIHLGT